MNRPLSVLIGLTLSGLLIPADTQADSIEQLVERRAQLKELREQLLHETKARAQAAAAQIRFDI